MAKKFEASQSVWFVARVMGAKKEEKETKSGKKYVEYNLTTRLPEGNTIYLYNIYLYFQQALYCISHFLYNYKIHFLVTIS